MIIQRHQVKLSAVVRRSLVCGGTTAACDSSLGLRIGGKKRQHIERTSTGAGGWKHQEETTLHPDSVSENKDNLFPSHSITVDWTAHGNRQ